MPPAPQQISIEVEKEKVDSIQIEGETWDEGYKVNKGDNRIVEFVRPEETVEVWTELVTWQRFKGLQNVISAKKFVESTKEQLESICPGLQWDYLTIKGYAVAVAGTAVEALESLAATPADLVITDGLLRGDIDGLGLIEELRRRNPRQGIIAMSGHPLLLPKLAETGVPVLQKPFNIKALDAAMRQMLIAP